MTWSSTARQTGFLESTRGPARRSIVTHTHIYSVAGIKFLIPVGVQPRSNLEDVAREIGRWPRKQKNYIVRDASGPSVFAVSHYVHRRNDKTCPITYFICLTMVLLPDSPAPEMKKRWNPLAYNIVWQIQRFFFFTSSIRSSIPYRVSPQVPNWVQAHDGLKLSHSLGAGQEKESCSVDLFYFFKRWRRKRRVFPPLPLPPIFVFSPLSLSLSGRVVLYTNGSPAAAAAAACSLAAVSKISHPDEKVVLFVLVPPISSSSSPSSVCSLSLSFSSWLLLLPGKQPPHDPFGSQLAQLRIFPYLSLCPMARGTCQLRLGGK